MQRTEAFLLPGHLKHLAESGLTLETITAAGLRSETNPVELSRILNWEKPAKRLGSAIVFPYFAVDGSVNGFARLRPDNPRQEGDKTTKYEQPRGVSNRAYFGPRSIAAINSPGAPLMIVEGEKKALAVDQAGIPVIGLPGVWAWQKKRNAKDEQRELIDDLAQIDWQDRLVVVVFDTDEKRNSHVGHAKSELAVVLERRYGAVVKSIELPLGPRDEHDMPAKVGVDDFIVHYGETAFLDLVSDKLSWQNRYIDLGQLQSRLAADRIDSLKNHGLYLDRSPTGSGKSFADIGAIRVAGSSLTVLPTHKNCEEVELTYRRHSINATSYPELNKKTCLNHDEAVAAIEAGLSASNAVCPFCVYRDQCDYRPMMEEADSANHSLATHKRAQFCLEKLSHGKKYVTIHEKVESVLRYTQDVASGFDAIAAIAEQAMHNAWERASRQVNEKNAQSDRYFFCRMRDNAYWLRNEIVTGTHTKRLEMSAIAAEPATADAQLFRAVKELYAKPDGNVMRVCKAITAGKVQFVVLRVDQTFAPGGNRVKHKSIVTVWQTRLPPKATIWANDATADVGEIQDMAERPVIDKTPHGQVRQRHPICQVPIDITKQTSAGRVVKILRGVLAAFDAQRVGVICDKKHKPTILGSARTKESLDAYFAKRIVKVEHFRGAEARGSNEWLDECDLLIVFGTPRVPPSAIKNRLIQRGFATAATRDGGWDYDYWSGRTPAGELQTVRGRGYRDHDWHRAHHSIVAAEIVQAVGRARTIRENGMPAVVVTTENLGFQLCEKEIQPLSTQHLAVLLQLEWLAEPNAKGAGGVLSEPNANVHILGNGSVSTSRMASAIGLSERRTRKILNELKNAGLVGREGERGKWYSTIGRLDRFLDSRTPGRLTLPPATAPPLDWSPTVDDHPARSP